jgi:hypothetical protein
MDACGDEGPIERATNTAENLPLSRTYHLGKMGVPSTDGVTTQNGLERWGEVFLASPAHFADRFARQESRE